MRARCTPPGAAQSCVTRSKRRSKPGWMRPLTSRCIRVRYKSGQKRVGGVVDAKPETHHGPQSRWWPGNAVDAPPCADLSVLTFSRFERSLQPGGERYDEREWSEDYDIRTARWRALPVGGRSGYSQEEHRLARPMRGRAVIWAAGRHACSYSKPEVRVLPWSQDTWDRLSVLAGQFAQLDAALHDLLICSDQQMFLDGLARVGLPLLGGPVEVP